MTRNRMVTLASTKSVPSALISGVIASVGQTGWIVSDHKLGFKLTKLNPIGGLKKLFSLNSLVELLKTLPKVALVTYVVVRAIQEELDHMMLSGILQPVDFIPFFGRAAWHVVARALAVFTVIAVIDFALQKYMWERNNRMTKQEVKDERKQMEGDPKIKSRIRALQREAARKRMMGDVPLADVVVTNPTHFAVAIRWNEAEMRASLTQSALVNSAYTYRDFSDAEIETYTEALEDERMSRVYELMNAIQWEVMANRFEVLAGRMAGMSRGEEL